MHRTQLQGLLFLSLSARTSSDEIDEVSKEIPGAGERLADLLQKQAQLNSSNPQKEKLRLENLAATCTGLKQDLKLLLTALDPERTGQRSGLGAAATAARPAATLAAMNTSEDEPLSGVGSESWRLLWEAARNYSVVEAYPREPFPVTDNRSHCVLCQQSLDDSAQDRLRRFEQYTANTTERDAEEAEAAFESTVEELRSLAFTSAELGARAAVVNLRPLSGRAARGPVCPARRVPMPAVVQSPFADVGRPDDQMRSPRTDFVIAARTTVGLRGLRRRNRANLVVVSVRSGLDAARQRKRRQRMPSR